MTKPDCLKALHAGPSILAKIFGIVVFTGQFIEMFNHIGDITAFIQPHQVNVPVVLPVLDRASLYGFYLVHDQSPGCEEADQISSLIFFKRLPVSKRISSDLEK